MGDAAVHLSLTSDEILSVHLKEKWQMETDVLSVETIIEQLNQHPSIKRIVFDATALGSWDSSLLIEQNAMAPLSTSDYGFVLEIGEIRMEEVRAGNSWTMSG
jgi:ABC-type branched-subunit amino acid transport system ATPase component